MNILIIQNKILHYRKALYNELSTHHNVTILHSGNSILDNQDYFKEIIVNVRKFGPFYIQNKVVNEVVSGEYDAVIAMFDIRWLSNIYAMFAAEKKSINFVWWGVYFTKNKIANIIRMLISHRDNSIIFYSKDAKESFINAGISRDKLFVANNTFHIKNRIEAFKSVNKDIILFVGSLDPRKQIEKLINAYSNIRNEIPQDIKLVIIGDGILLDSIVKLVNEMDLESHVYILGRLTKSDDLVPYYRRAIVSVSFGQAGLSVLQSMGFGVPFITQKTAISGGEKSNIIHGVNGFLIDDNQEVIEEHLKSVCKDINKAKIMGKSAYKYYTEYCTISNMVHGFKQALNYKGYL